MGAIYTVNAKTFDREIKRSWTAELLEETSEFVLLKGIFDRNVLHPDLGEIKQGTISFEYFWPDRWYNVFRFHDPDGAFLSYYCNVTLPPFIGEGLIEYIDLDIDVLVSSRGMPIVLDEEEFTENSIRFSYPQELIDTVPRVVDSLRQMVRDRIFPFDQMEQSSE